MELRLPSEYQEVEYIISDNGAYFDLPAVSYNIGDTIRSAVKLQYLGTLKNNFWLSGDGSQKGGVQYEYGYFSQWWWHNTKTFSDDKIAESFTGTFPNEIIEVDWTHEYAASTNIVFRVCQRNGFSAEKTQRKAYYVKLYKNNTLLNNCIPCYRKADGEIGMYDTVTKTFYTNLGEGKFLKGADITRYIDNVSVLDTRRKILLNTPHIDTSVGDLVTFNTDLSAPLKSCKVSFLPVQEGEGDPSPDNVRNITGWNGVEEYSCGKNLAHIFGYGTQNISDTDVNKYKITNTYGTTINTTIFNNPDTPLIIEQSQAPDSTAPNTYRNGYIVIGTDNLIFGQKYNVSFKVSNITNNILNTSLNKIRLLAPNGSATSVTEIIDDILIFKNITFSQNTAAPKRKGFEIRICGLSFTLSEFMVTAVDNEDYTYESFQGTTTSVDWTDSTGTIYRGHLDLINGVLTATWVKIHLTSSYIDGFGATNTAPYRAYTKQISGAKRYDYPNFTNNIICDKIAPMAVGTKDLWYPYEYIGYINNSGRFVFGLSSEQSTKDLAKQWIDAIGGLDLCYELAEPVTYQLTPQQLTTLRGINNIWSSANGEVEIKYWKH